MEFALGVIVGLVLALLVVATLTFFRTQVERKVQIFERVVHQAGPRPRGKIFIPPSEADATREEIIKKNREQGKDTPIDELV